jgi:hypothetical protein
MFQNYEQGIAAIGRLGTTGLDEGQAGKYYQELIQLRDLINSNYSLRISRNAIS